MHGRLDSAFTDLRFSLDESSGGSRGGSHRGAGGVMTTLLAAVWLLLDYSWGLLAFVAIAALFGLR